MKQLKSISKNVHPLKEALQKFSLDEILYVPIDVAKFSHTASAVDFFGDVVRQPFAFANSRKGVKFFLKELRKTMRLRKAKAVFVGLEASGQYHELLTLALRESGLDVAVINPLDGWRERENPHAKNDRIDLGPITRVIIANKGSRSNVPEGVYYQLFRAARTRRKYVSIRAACKNRITSVVDRLFPGYWTNDDPLFSDRWGKASVLILRHYPTPQQLIKLGVKRLARFLANHNTKLGLPKARKIVERARDALRRPLEDLQVDRLVLSRFLNDYDNACGAIAELEPHVVRLLIQTPGVAILSVPGIGLAHGGDFTGLLGDISRFAHYSQVISFAGHPSKTKDSGQWQSDGGAMSKKGNPQFRTVLNQIALSLNTYCDDFTNYYTRKYLEKGECSGIAKVATANKFIRVAFALMSRAELYNPPTLSRDPSVRKQYHRNTFQVMVDKLAPHIPPLGELPQDCTLIRLATKYGIDINNDR